MNIIVSCIITKYRGFCKLPQLSKTAIEPSISALSESIKLTQSPERISPIKRHIKGYVIPSFTISGSVMVTIASYTEFTSLRPYLLWGGLALVAIGVVATIAFFPNYSRLAKFKEKIVRNAHRSARELRPILPRLLKRIAEDTGLIGPNYRLSLYQYRDNLFQLVARSSENTNLAQGRRVVFPATREGGLLMQAWTHGIASISQLPLRDSWRSQAIQASVGGSPTDASSRSMAALALTDDEIPVGVLVVESTEPRGINGKVVDMLNNHSLKVALAWMLGSLEFSGVDLDLSTEE